MGLASKACWAAGRQLCLSGLQLVVSPASQSCATALKRGLAASRECLEQYMQHAACCCRCALSLLQAWTRWWTRRQWWTPLAWRRPQVRLAVQPVCARLPGLWIYLALPCGGSSVAAASPALDLTPTQHCAAHTSPCPDQPCIAISLLCCRDVSPHADRGQPNSNRLRLPRAASQRE